MLCTYVCVHHNQELIDVCCIAGPATSEVHRLGARPSVHAYS